MHFFCFVKKNILNLFIILREMREGVERNRKHENELTNVFQQYSKTILLPNRLSEIIDTNVKFCAR